METKYVVRITGIILIVALSLATSYRIGKLDYRDQLERTKKVETKKVVEDRLTIEFKRGFLFCPSGQETLFYGEVKSPVFLKGNTWEFSTEGKQNFVVGECHLEVR